MKIAIAGKGGVGKTTLAAGLAKLFALNGYQVYAVDADPDISLGTTLGVSKEVLSSQPPLIEMKELIRERTGAGGAFYILNPQVDDILDKYVIELGSIKLLRMGGYKQVGSSCYCPENAFLNAVVNSLLLGKREVVILDFGAGIEHLTRGTARGVDLMLIVTEPTRVSVETARVIQQMAKDMGIANIKIVGNKIHSSKEREFLYTCFNEGDVLACMDYDDALWERAMSEETGGLEEVIIKTVKGVFDRIMSERRDAVQTGK